jgi:cytochrome c oxidase assembly protein subunit 11
MIPSPPPARKHADLKVAGFAAGVAMTMLGVSFAAVPLYDWFCRTTGYGGTTMVAKEAPQKTGVREITVRFDANVTGNLGWKFTPEVASIKVVPGEVKTVYYRLTNVSNRDTVGIASYGVTPERTGGFFSKIACFCFTDQTLKAGESREEAVVFFVDPALEKDPDLKNINTITLSYTFFPSKTQPKPLAALSSESGVVAR